MSPEHGIAAPWNNAPQKLCLSGSSEDQWEAGAGRALCLCAGQSETGLTRFQVSLWKKSLPISPTTSYFSAGGCSKSFQVVTL